MENWPKEKSDFCAVNCSKEDKIKIINNQSLEECFYDYAKNYKEAARIITEDALDSNNIGVLDINFFGLAFLYRHSIELILKAIGFKYIKEETKRKNFIKETFHNLYDITRYISPFINEYIDNDKGAYNWMMEIFNDMNSIDKESDSFRYPFGIVKKDCNEFNVKKKEFGIKHFFDKQTHINLFSFANKMEIIFCILDSYYLERKYKITEYREYSTVFLEEGGGYYAQSVIGYEYNKGTFNCNVTAYRNCADILYNIINKNSDKKNLFMPLCYLYRNSIELAMKEILFEESSLGFQRALKSLNDKKHKLCSIWEEIKEDIREHARTSEDDKVLLNVETYIKNLNDIDGSADVFRYPSGKHLNVYFKNIKSFDLKNVRDFFEDILAFMSAACEMMSEQNAALREIENEFRVYDFDYI